MTDPKTPDNRQQKRESGLNAFLKEIKDLPPDELEFISKNLQKADRFLDNPMVSGFLGNIVGMDINELKKITGSAEDGLINIKKTKKTEITGPGEKTIYDRTTATIKQSGSSTNPVIPKTAPSSPIPSRDSKTIQPGKIDARGFLVIMVCAGFIVWLLYQFTDII